MRLLSCLPGGTRTGGTVQLFVAATGVTQVLEHWVYPLSPCSAPHHLLVSPTPGQYVA